MSHSSDNTSSSSSSSSFAKAKKDKRSKGRKNLVVITEWSEEKKSQFYQTQVKHVTPLSNSAEPEPFSNCLIWTGSLQNGYPAVSQGHGQSKVKMHILAAERSLGRLPTEEECVSHLCHRKKCINAQHLVIESLGKNNSRKGCLCALKHGNLLFGLCPHEPKCLRADTETIGSFKPTVTDLASFVNL
jgi:hypothetical protein